MIEISKRIQEAANNKKYASEFTHGIYRYPASMSPLIAREIISLFTKKRDVIIDPFCGGGTTAIEALSHGRKIICSDVNSLACFITKTKATPLKNGVIEKIKLWSAITLDRLREYRKKEVPDNFSINKNLHCKKTLWLLTKLMHEANLQLDPQVRDICNLIMLSVGKLCYDCRVESPNPSKLVKAFNKISHSVIKSIIEYSDRCLEVTPNIDIENHLKIFCENALNLPELIDRKDAKRIKLVLTSPPYPGVHILYHRWQIKGRRQTSLPYNLLHLNDGLPASYYTLGSASNKGYESYFKNIRNIFSNLWKVIGEKTIIAQVVSFKESEWQLPMYKKAMREAGYSEIYLTNNKGDIITRDVPNRKWYTNLMNKKAQEYILFHSKI